MDEIPINVFFFYRFSLMFHITSILSILFFLTKLRTHNKQSLLKYFGTVYSRRWVNQIWIHENSKALLEHPQSPNFNHILSIKSLDSPTLYTTIPHEKLESRLASIKWISFIFKNGNHRYKFLATKRHILILRLQKASSLKMTSIWCLSFW